MGFLEDAKDKWDEITAKAEEEAKKAAGRVLPVSLQVDPNVDVGKFVDDSMAWVAGQTSKFGQSSEARPFIQLVEGVGRAFDEGIGEISGRNRRRAQDEAQRLLDVEAAKRATELANEQARAQRQDVAASQAAGLATQQASAQQRATLGGGGNDYLTKDFLGLS